jgi:hypothetical protein
MSTGRGGPPPYPRIGGSDPPAYMGARFFSGEGSAISGGGIKFVDPIFKNTIFFKKQKFKFFFQKKKICVFLKKNEKKPSILIWPSSI